MNIVNVHLLSLHLVHKDVGLDLTEGCCLGFGRCVISTVCISALYHVLCQFGISARSLFSKSTHLNCVPPGVLLLLCGLHLSTCFCVRWSGILCKWPNHCSLFSLSWCSTGCSSVSLRTSAFWRLCQRVTPSMSCRHLSLARSPLHTVESTLLRFWILASWYAYWGCIAAKDFLSPNLVHCPSFLYPCGHFLLQFAVLGFLGMRKLSHLPVYGSGGW